MRTLRAILRLPGMLLAFSWMVLTGQAAAEGPSTAQAHWAFTAPARPPAPQNQNPQWFVRTPIDAFIFALLQQHDLRPAAEARKEVLLRRVYLDLIGLPPTREELHSFLSDRSPDAYEKVVDRLLNSPRHAERWARHWMDIWRYSDWYGRRHVPDVWNSAPQVWRWRDWIVRSLNADKGYDRMLVEMLAADEVSPEDDNARAATGYIVRNWYALNPNQWMRDLVEHTGKAFLGLTFNCAHCHDHKYDPITQRDYFQFRAFFEPLQVRQDWIPGEPSPGPFQKYEYSSLRKVVTNGLVSVFDENLQAKTFIYLRGDERSFPEGKPSVEPNMPQFLGGNSLNIRPVDLPATAHYPGLKRFIQRSEIQKHEDSLVTARKALTAAEKALLEARARYATPGRMTNSSESAEVQLLIAKAAFRNKSNQLSAAVAELNGVRARIAADVAKYFSAIDGSKNSQPESMQELIATAGRAEKLASLRRAESKLVTAKDALELLQAEQAISVARRALQASNDSKEEEKNKTAVAKAKDQVALAQQAVEAAEAALKSTDSDYTPFTPVYPMQSTGRRRALAEWIVNRANPLAARVAVNHIWSWHFHAPLVASVFDFGRNGTMPTHPELLDWLAVELMEHNWSMKHLHRLIVTSSVYRRSTADTVVTGSGPESGPESGHATADPENRYLWRMNPSQMEAEVLRDSILYVAGELDLTPAGYPVPNSDAETSRRRSLYFECFPEPNGQSQFAELFDAPNPMECYRRSQTIVPQQALAMANSQLSNSRSTELARHLATTSPPTAIPDDTAFLRAAFEQVLSRGPTTGEIAACRNFLEKQKVAGAEAARASLIHVLFNHNDFVTIR